MQWYAHILATHVSIHTVTQLVLLVTALTAYLSTSAHMNQNSMLWISVLGAPISVAAGPASLHPEPKQGNVDVMKF